MNLPAGLRKHQQRDKVRQMQIKYFLRTVSDELQQIPGLDI